MNLTRSALWCFLASFGAIMMLFGTLLAWFRARRLERDQLCDADLAITVMKPLSGQDPRLEENLESFARLKAPPAFEVLLCLGRETDAAYPVAREFVRRYPERFRLTVGIAPDFGNAKIAQLLSAFPQVDNHLIWVSESNVETSQPYLEALARTWKRANAKGRVKTLVHAPLVGVGGQGVGAALERMHLSSLQNPNHELARLVGLHAVVGKTEFFHRDDLLALGGFEAFGNYLGEDFMMATAFGKAGVVRCIGVPTRNVLGPMTAHAWFDRHARWAVMRKTMVGPAFYFLEPLIHLGFPTLLFGCGLIPGWWLAMLWLARVFIDGANFALQARQLPRWTDLMLVPLKEAGLLLAWVNAVFSVHVKWRADRAIELGPHSRVLSTNANPSALSRQYASLRRVLGKS